jgi:hypothetical protein
MRDEFDAFGELSELRRAGGSLSELQIWLKSKRVEASRSTIHRYLGKRREVSDG